MKILLLFFISLSSFAASPDLKIAKENINRIHQLAKYYEKEVYPLLKKLESDKLILYSSEEKKTIKDFWTLFNDTKMTLNTLVNTTRSDDPLIKYSANLHIYYIATILSKSLWHNPKARKRLNNTNSNEIPRGSFINLENELFKSIGFNQAELPSFFPTTILSEDKLAISSITDSDLAQFNLKTEVIMISYQSFLNNLKNYKEVKKRFRIYQFKNIFYQLVKKISIWLGDTKTRNRNPDYYNGNTLIDIKLAKQMEQKVQPGDIMLSRTDWFLSNMFLPGFWSHSFIYLGDQNKLSAYFDTHEINQYYQTKCRQMQLECKSFISYLQKRFDAFKEYQKRDKYGYPQTLIEATSEGVHFSSIRHTFLNDYLAAIRPQISKLEKAMAIESSFEFYGLEYDYDFDYESDDKLVCSELVGKAMYPFIIFNYNIDKKEYLEKIMRRPSMPVQNILRKLYDEDIRSIRRQELEFVAFLKGYPKTKNAKFVNKNSFYKSLKRKKWTFMEKN